VKDGAAAQARRETVDGGATAGLSAELPDLRHERLAHLVRQAARGFVRSLQYRLAGQDITFGQWVFLRILWQRDGLTQRELSDAAGLVEPTAHSALTRLERLGLVNRRNLPGNRRKLHVFLTPAGKALRRQLEPLAEEVNAVAVSGIAERDVEAVRRTLIAIIANLAEDEARSLAKGRRIPPTRTRL
jgi:MarR family transcriptional regulator, organic hydroperoxide resistance regulator